MSVKSMHQLLSCYSAKMKVAGSKWRAFFQCLHKRVYVVSQNSIQVKNFQHHWLSTSFVSAVGQNEIKVKMVSTSKCRLTLYRICSIALIVHNQE